MADQAPAAFDDERRCIACGGTWWHTSRMALTKGGQVTRYAVPLTCADCGALYTT